MTTPLNRRFSSFGGRCAAAATNRRLQRQAEPSVMRRTKQRFNSEVTEFVDTNIVWLLQGAV